MKWFFASWDEDVNVPVDEEAGQISGMAQTLQEQVGKLGQCARNKLLNSFGLKAFGFAFIVHIKL